MRCRLAVLWSLGCVLVVLAGPGCTSSGGMAREEAFGPGKMRLHPSFTRLKDWTGDGNADGIEAVVELFDSFGDPTRGSGTFLFEISDFRANDPHGATKRIAGPFIEVVETREQQTAKYSQPLRAYTFQLPMAKLNPAVTYVIDVSYESVGGASRPGGGRLFDRLILEPSPDIKKPDEGVKRGAFKRPTKG